MTVEEFAPIAKVLNATYGTADKPFMDKTKFTVWHHLLQDLPVEVVKGAVTNICLTHEFLPKPATVRAECAKITTPPLPNEQEAWAMVREAIRDSTYNAEKHYSEFPEVVKRAVADSMQLFHWGQCSSEQVDTVIQSQFLRCYRAEVERSKGQSVLGLIGTAEGTLMIEGGRHE